MSRNHTSEKGTPDYTQSKDWSIRWQHSQDPKANPYTTFSASVDMSSATNNYYNANNINDIANQRKQSSISWSKKWPDRPFNITASFTHNQNSRDSSISLSFPNLNFRYPRYILFGVKNVPGKLNGMRISVLPTMQSYVTVFRPRNPNWENLSRIWPGTGKMVLNILFH